MQLVRLNPSHELRAVEDDLEKVWQRNWSVFPTLTETAPMDLYEQSGKLIAKVALPHFSKDQIDIHIGKKGATS